MAKSKGSEQWAKARALWVTHHLEGSSEFDTEILRLLNSAIELGLGTGEEATARSERGEIYLRQGHLSEAEVDLKKALELNNQSEKKMISSEISGTWRNLSTLHGKWGNRAQAIKCLEEGIKQLQDEYNQEDPEILKWHLITLHCLLATKYWGHDNGQALSIYLRALEIDPHAPMLRMLLGEFYCNKKESAEFYNPQKAIEHWEQYLALEKGDSPVDRNEKERVQKNLEILKKESKKDGKCFIATVVYGDTDAPEVRLLRQFRDEFLLSSLPGRFFVSAYYFLSPKMIIFLKGDKTKGVIKFLVVGPAIWIANKKLSSSS